jgi:hypothetical protein
MNLEIIKNNMGAIRNRLNKGESIFFAYHVALKYINILFILTFMHSQYHVIGKFRVIFIRHACHLDFMK